MLRSKRYVFVPFCLLAQGVRATGIVKRYSSAIAPVVNLLMEENVNIIQMMCPELIFDGFHRKPCGRLKYDTPQNHKICQEVAEKQVQMMEMLINNGHSVEAIVGIEFSPSCAVSRLTGKWPRGQQKGEGIYVEELRKLMDQKGIKVPFIGIQMYHMSDTLRELSEVLRKN